MAGIMRSWEFFGNPVKKWQGRDVRLEVSEFPEKLEVPRHQHQNAYLCAVLDGYCVETEGISKHPMHAGSVTLYAPGSEHSNLWRHPGRCLHVEIEPELWSRVGKLGSLPDRLVAGPEMAPAARDILREFMRGNPASLLACEGLVLCCLSRISEFVCADRMPPKWLLEVRDKLSAEVCTDTSLTDLAIGAGVHPSHSFDVVPQTFWRVVRQLHHKTQTGVGGYCA